MISIDNIITNNNEGTLITTCSGSIGGRSSKVTRFESSYLPTYSVNHGLTHTTILFLKIFVLQHASVQRNTA